MPHYLGIDLGTTNTSASLIQHVGQVAQPIALQIGPLARRDIMRSVALRLADGRWIAGDKALEPNLSGVLLSAFKQYLALPARGRTFWEQENDEGVLRDDPNSEGPVASGAGIVFKLMTESLPGVNLPKGVILSHVPEATRALLAEVNSELQKQHRGVRPDGVVIGVPISYSDIGRERLITAAVEAGLVSSRGKVSLLHEPIAVALAYSVEYRTPKRVLVFDHGGGTLDLSIIDIMGNPEGDFHYRVLAQAGHERAGRYYDRLLLSAILGDARQEGTKVLEHLRVKKAMDIDHVLVLDSAERVKQALCQPGVMARQRFAFPFGTHSFSHEVAPELFDEVLQDELAVIRTKLEALVQDAEQSGAPAKPSSGPGGVEEILLAGGSAQVPAIQRLIKEMFPGIALNGRFAGTRTSTVGFARAVQYRSLIDELTDTEYSLYAPDTGKPFPVLKLGTKLRETTTDCQLGDPDGCYIRADGKKATLILMHAQHERYRPVLEAEVEFSAPGEVVQVMVYVAQDTGLPLLKVVSCATQRELSVRLVPEGTMGNVPMLEPGQIIRFRENRHRIYNSRGSGCIARIVHLKKGNVPLAVGDMGRYKLCLQSPGGASEQVWTDTDYIELYDIPLPRPGEKVELKRLEETRFIKLEPFELHPFERVGCPEGFQRAERVVQFLPAQGSPHIDREEQPVEQPQSSGRKVGSRLQALLNRNSAG